VGVRVWNDESGKLRHELGGFRESGVNVIKTFTSAHGQARLVVGSLAGDVRLYDPESGSELHRFEARGSSSSIAELPTELAIIESSSAPPHYPRVAVGYTDDTVLVVCGETRDRLAFLGIGGRARGVTAWKEQVGGRDRDRLATFDKQGERKIDIWDGETLTKIRKFKCDPWTARLWPLKAAGGRSLLVTTPQYGDGAIDVWDPEEGRKLHTINDHRPFATLHAFRSAQGRDLVAITGRGRNHTRHRPNPKVKDQPMCALDVWDLGDFPPAPEPPASAPQSPEKKTGVGDSLPPISKVERRASF
jgi:WD40 repeat protein